MKDINPSFNEIKKELVERVEAIENYMADGKKIDEELRVLLRRISDKVYGDLDVFPPKLGFDERLRALEEIEKERLNVKRGLLNVAVGSLTMAIGAAVLWIVKVVHVAFIKVP